MKLTHGMNPVEFDLYASTQYRSKANDAKGRKLDFNLTFSEFRRIIARKHCHYTGKAMTLRPLNPGGEYKQKPTDLTIERIDNSKGYVSGNCIAVCYAANNIKSVFENPSSPLSVEDAIRMFSKIGEMQK